MKLELEFEFSITGVLFDVTMLAGLRTFGRKKLVIVDCVHIFCVVESELNLGRVVASNLPCGEHILIKNELPVELHSALLTFIVGSHSMRQFSFLAAM